LANAFTGAGRRGRSVWKSEQKARIVAPGAVLFVKLLIQSAAAARALSLQSCGQAGISGSA
jgi:hypothetical protein